MGLRKADRLVQVGLSMQADRAVVARIRALPSTRSSESWCRGHSAGRGDIEAAGTWPRWCRWSWLALVKGDGRISILVESPSGNAVGAMLSYLPVRDVAWRGIGSRAPRLGALW